MPLKKLSTILLTGFSIILFSFVNPSYANTECPTFAQRIYYGETYTGRITDMDYAVVYCFSGLVGDEVTIEMTATSGNLDTNLGLTSPTAETVYALNDDISNSNTNSRIQTTLPITGNFTVIATRYNYESGTSTGSFSLSISVAVPVARATATPITRATSTPVANVTSTGTSVSDSDDLPDCNYGIDTITVAQVNTSILGEITDENYIDVYCFRAKTGDKLTIDTEATSGDLDTVLLLTNLANEHLSFNDDYASGTRNSRVEFEILVDDIYLLSVSRYGVDTGTSSGEYKLWVGKPYVCNETPWSILTDETWIQSSEDGVDISFDFACDGKVGVSFGDNFFVDTYIFDRDTIQLVASDIFLEDILIVEGIMLASFNESFLIMTTESFLATTD